MNSDTAASIFVMLLVAIGMMLLIICISTPAAAVCLTKKEARHLWPRQHIYWYSKDHCWSNRQGPPRGLKLDPVLEKTRAEAKPAKTVEAPLSSDQPMKIMKDFCCWPDLKELMLDRWKAIKGWLENTP